MEKKAAAGRIVVLDATEDSLFEARRRSAEDVMAASIYIFVVDVSLQNKNLLTRWRWINLLSRLLLVSFGFNSPTYPNHLLPFDSGAGGLLIVFADRWWRLRVL